MQSKFDGEAQHQIKSTNKVICIFVVDQSTMTKRVCYRVYSEWQDLPDAVGDAF
jgi:hypothetical protein